MVDATFDSSSAAGRRFESPPLQRIRRRSVGAADHGARKRFHDDIQAESIGGDDDDGDDDLHFDSDLHLGHDVDSDWLSPPPSPLLAAQQPPSEVASSSDSVSHQPQPAASSAAAPQQNRKGRTAPWPVARESVLAQMHCDACAIFYGKDVHTTAGTKSAKESVAAQWEKIAAALTAADKLQSPLTAEGVRKKFEGMRKKFSKFQRLVALRNNGGSEDNRELHGYKPWFKIMEEEDGKVKGSAGNIINTGVQPLSMLDSPNSVADGVSPPSAAASAAAAASPWLAQARLVAKEKERTSKTQAAVNADLLRTMLTTQQQMQQQR